MPVGIMLSITIDRGFSRTRVSKIEWLLTKRAQEFAAIVREQLLANENILRILKRLRKGISPAEAAMAVELGTLQLRARTKFSRAEKMLFTKTSLEQATSERLALYKASRFPRDQKIADICCGIGGDSIGIGQSHELAAVDQQNLLCKMAEHNLTVCEIPKFKVVNQSFSEFDIVDYDCLHFDPDRRVAGRTVLPNDFSPSFDEILSGIGRRLTAIKVAPASNLPHDLREMVHREWIGERREAKQQLIWLNHPEYPRGSATCTVVTGGGIEKLTFTNDAQFRPAPVADQLNQYVYEPHAAVIAARMISGLAREYGLSRVGQGAAYLTGDRPINSSLLATFKVEVAAPLYLEKIAELVRQNDYGEIEWKKRAVEQETYEQLKRIRTRGERKVTAIVTPTPRGPAIIFCHRLPTSEQPPAKVDPAKNGA
jgi:hypothetical protein